jgi:DNA-binding response OmpR family regulator
MRVAVVDDDPRLRELLAAELEDGGCTVLRCGDGGELLAAQRAGSLADVELVLLDWMMPRLDGLTCLRQLRAGGFQGRVVVITALCDPAQRQAALDAGANDYVLKTALLDGVERLLTR